MRLSAREQGFLTRCGTKRLGRDVEWHDALETTQARAKERIAEGAGEGTLVVASRQSGGYGRKGDPWHSPEGGLWASLVLKPAGPATEAAGLTVLFARSLRECLLFDFCLPAVVKEPNDVLVEGKKIAGILADATSRAGEERIESLVLGFGVNVANPLPDELVSIAVSMARFLREPPPPEDVLARVLERFEALYPAPRAVL